MEHVKLYIIVFTAVLSALIFHSTIMDIQKYNNQKAANEYFESELKKILK